MLCLRPDHTTFTSLRSPYFIWLGRSRSCDVSRFCHAFEVECGNMIGNCSPSTLIAVKGNGTVTPLEIGQSIINLQQTVASAAVVIDIRAPLSSFHYQVDKVSTNQ